MLTPEGFASILVALLALLGTIIVAISNQGKLSKDDAVSLEHRLTLMEGGQKLIQQDVAHVKENMFSRQDRECLTILNERVENIMTTLASMIPKSLKNPKHLDMILDTLSEKASTSGWTAVVDFVKTELPAQDRVELLVYLESQSKSRSKQRRLWAGLYLGMLKLELDMTDDAVCEV